MKNKKKILFIIPPITERVWSNHYYEIYLGLAYIAGLIAGKGHTVRVIDCDAEFHPLLSLKNKIKRFNPDIIGLTALYGSLNNAFKIAKTAKNNNALLVMGGLPATFIPEHILKKCPETGVNKRYILY